MFDIGLQELVVIFAIALLVFGPRRLPELGRALGRAMREFRRASDEFRSTFETNLMTEPAPEAAPPAPEPERAVPDGTAGLPPLSDELLADPSWDATTGETAAPRGEETAPSEPFVARRDGRLFHRVECGWARKIAESDRLVWKRAADALDQGHQPCPVCGPRDD